MTALPLIYFCDDSRHLVCAPYSIANLHRMADDLGVNRCWYHTGRWPHYDIPKRRVEEIKKKCTVVSSVEILSIIRRAMIIKCSKCKEPIPPERLEAVPTATMCVKCHTSVL